MKDMKWLLALGLVFLVFSTGLYIAQIVIFHKAEETFFLLFQDLAFLPLHVLLVVIILEKLLKRFEHQSVMKKLNMIVGVFFIEVGTDLIRMFAEFDKTNTEAVKFLQIGDKWTEEDFANARKQILNFDFQVEVHRGYIGDLQVFFRHRRRIIMGLMENPNLLEHESFTDMFLAVQHLCEELSMRKHLTKISASDTKHLAGDMKRAYAALVVEWISYMRHLKKEYPYLYSLAVRTNPFNPDSKVEFS